MTNTSLDYRISKLTPDFYAAYPNPPYVEILKKANRAYNCLLVKAYDNIFMCIPYRTHISHKYAYHFKNSVRSRFHQSGLNYTKMVIIQNPDFIDDSGAVIDANEFRRRYCFSPLKYFHKELGIL